MEKGGVAAACAVVGSKVPLFASMIPVPDHVPPVSEASKVMASLAPQRTVGGVILTGGGGASKVTFTEEATLFPQSSVTVTAVSYTHLTLPTICSV